MNLMKRNKINIVVATDLLSRGIDIKEIDLVINFDMPTTVETYLHRIGRTGRFGRYGASILFLTNKDESFVDINMNIFNSLLPFPKNIDSINKKFLI
jgi:superfamily II DNA/RNA helicase